MTATLQPRILVIATSSTGALPPAKEPTGLWLSEFVHFWREVTQEGCAVDVASPQGGAIPLDPRSLNPLFLDETTRTFHEDADCVAILANSAPVAGIDWQPYDAVYFPGGHGTLWDFPDNPHIHALVRALYERGRVVAAVCHGPAALLNVRLSDGRYLLASRRVTGYSWNEERVMLLAEHLPLNLEEEMGQRGARYEKSFLPMARHVVLDRNLITGQNPASARGVAREVVQALRMAVQSRD